MKRLIRPRPIGTRPFALVCLLLAMALVAAACGGDDGSRPESAAEAIEGAPEAVNEEVPERTPDPAADEVPEEAPEAAAEAAPDETPEAVAEEMPPSPVEILEAYRLAYNTDDMDAVMVLFTEETVLTDHPAALYQGLGDGSGTLTGLDEIREANVVDRASATNTDAYEFVNIELSGDTVTWDHSWLASNGAEWCGEAHSAVIVDGMFLTWAYGPAEWNRPCSPDCSLADVFVDIAPDRCGRSSP